MKKLVFAIVFIISFFSFSCVGQKNKMSVREIYYSVDEQGIVNERRMIGERLLVFTRERGATQIKYHGGFRHDLESREVDSYDVFRTIPNKSEKETRVYDDHSRLVACVERVDDVSSIKYTISYNQYDDPIEIKSVRDNSDGITVSLPTITFNYFYFCDVPTLEYEDKEIAHYHQLRIVPSERGCPWMLRTIKKDGIIIQHVERKYRK